MNNELYVGLLVWNRLRYIKDPDTGNRVSRPNPKSDWIVQDVSHLRIIDDELWEQVKERQAAILKRFETKPGPNKLDHTHRRKFLLSGLLSCGTCIGSYSVRGQDRYGCFNHYNRGTCDNKRTIKRQVIEANGGYRRRTGRLDRGRRKGAGSYSSKGPLGELRQQLTKGIISQVPKAFGQHDHT